MKHSSGVDSSHHAPRNTRGEARRQRLLCAARDVFLEKGYNGASINEIVARAGGSLSTLYKQFGSKEGLFVAALEAHAANVWTRLEEGRNRPPQDVLFELAQGLIDLIFAQSHLRLIRSIAAEAERTPELGRLFLERGPDRTRRELADYLQSQHERGTIHVEDPRASASMFTGMVLGEWMIGALVGRVPTIDTEERNHRARICTDMFLTGLRGMAERN
ncbi:TetR family transcriptional regulator [Halomonas cupida]|uniref:TetR family transcriptional regulator n=1 Tax=Halomonas cupida TaxID=44933 RepID=A0ABQ0WKC3_9GAMM|nr:TetR/AcrR family transcriptional regulator [Halomonas cupida]GEN26225.1 TetR family transcriptional regulator [Halomonas cupida]